MAADLRFNEFATDATCKVQVQLLRYTDILQGMRGLWPVVGSPPTMAAFGRYTDAPRIKVSACLRGLRFANAT